jgi:hypothetical protein
VIRARRLLVVLILLAAGPADAGEIEIRFDFLTSSKITAYGGQIQVPPQGSMFAGSAVLVVPGTSTSAASAGAAQMRGVSAGLSVNALTLGANVVGSFFAFQAGTASGTLSAGLGKVTLGGPLTLSAMGGLDCGGNFNVCSLLGNFALVFTGTQTISSGPRLTLRNVNLSGQAELEGRIPLSFSGATGVLDLIGTEVSRTYVPEPSVGTQLGAAIVAVCVLATWRRRRRVARAGA